MGDSGDYGMVSTAAIERIQRALAAKGLKFAIALQASS